MMGASRSLRRLFLTFLALFAGALLAEMTARGYALVGGNAGRRLASRDLLETVYVPYGNFGYRQRPGMTEKFLNGASTVANSMGYRGPLVTVDKPKGSFRIVLLGGSTTNGYGVNDDSTIDAQMRRLLPRQFPSVCFEVVNLALGGYDSYQDFERMRVDGTKLSPDLVILNSGINDVRNAQYDHLSAPPDPRTLFWESAMAQMREELNHGPSLWTLANHYSYAARIPGFVRELWQQRREVEVIRAVEPHDSAVEYFALNVERTIELALNIRASVILSTPPSALSTRNKPSDPPEKTYWIKDAGTTDKYRRRLAARMQQIAAQGRAAGKPVYYATHSLPLEEFIDDAHLTSAGNLTVARDFVEAATPFIRAALPTLPTEQPSCTRTPQL
jgi:lysophospholipase L1-like esterase